ncbi:hypothetical protein IFM89_021216 [Coptis chinensis]|uniref:Uncharacterized protein n=1 Tax=Coptis chinensis TaxID=261450 RepID=A0A835LNB4_9MAGN|nr:hypothetical protein IFM89_021216 [Coptis chinensis]
MKKQWLFSQLQRTIENILNVVYLPVKAASAAVPQKLAVYPKKCQAQLPLIKVSPPWRSQAMQLANLIAVIGPQYCASVPVTFTVVRKVRSINDGNLTAVDIKGNIIFGVRLSRSFFFPGENVLLDANGYPLVTSRATVWSLITTFS